MPTLDDVGPHVRLKLVNMLGAERAEELVSRVFPGLGLTRLETSDDRLRFGEALTKLGGMFAVLGRSIQTQAILHGAITDLDTAVAARKR